MGKRERDADAGPLGKRGRRGGAGRGPRGGGHQRHRVKLVAALARPAASGVFMTCARGKERKAAAELAERMDELYVGVPLQAEPAPHDEDDMDALRNGPASAAPAPAAPASASEAKGPAEGIEAQIHAELAQLQDTPAEERTPRCTVLDTETECLCYVQCTPPIDAQRVVHALLEEVQRTGASFSRHVQRLSPVHALCRAEPEAIRAAASQYIPRIFTADRARTFRIEPRIRSHTSLSRDRLIPLVASCIPANGGHRADLSRSEVVVLVEVFKNVCGIGAVEHYEDLGKMNVQTLVERWQMRQGGEDTRVRSA